MSCVPTAELFSSLRVLLVDDVHAIRYLMRTLLRSFNVQSVVEASDGAKALELARSYPLDLVITDVSMRPMDGLAFTRCLRRPGPYLNPTLPVLILSSHAEEAVVRAAVEAGANEYLAKPITRAALAAKLVSILQSKHLIIQSASYCGPDRRRTQRGPNHGRRDSDGLTVLI